MANALIFYLIAAVTVISAVRVVTSRNIVHAALFMILSFVGVAGVYVMLYADFLAAVQIMVYVGAISIVILFGVMLTRRTSMSHSSPFSWHRYFGAIMAVSIFALLVLQILGTAWPVQTVLPVSDTVGSLADLILGKYVIAFEVTALLLLATTIGAIILAKEVSE